MGREQASVPDPLRINKKLDKKRKLPLELPSNFLILFSTTKMEKKSLFISIRYVDELAVTGEAV